MSHQKCLSTYRIYIPFLLLQKTFAFFLNTVFIYIYISIYIYIYITHNRYHLTSACGGFVMSIFQRTNIFTYVVVYKGLSLTKSRAFDYHDAVTSTYEYPIGVPQVNVHLIYAALAGPVFYLLQRDISANERERCKYICDVVSHLRRPCTVIKLGPNVRPFLNISTMSLII